MPNRSTFVRGDRIGSFVLLHREGRYRVCRCDCGQRMRVRVDHLRATRCQCQKARPAHG